MSQSNARHRHAIRSAILLLTLMLSTLLALPAQALVPVDLATLEQRIDLLPHVQFRQAPVGLDLAGVMALDDAGWQDNPEGKMSFGQFPEAL